MAGIFDYQDPDSVGRMMFAAGLLNAAGPSKMPVSVGQALSQGLLARQQGAMEAAQSARRNSLIESQVAHQQMLMKELQRQQAEQEQARQLMRQSYQTPRQQAVSQFRGPTNLAAQAMPQMPGGFDAGLMRNQALQAGNPYAVQLAESLQKARNVQKLGKDDRLVDLTENAPRVLVDAQPSDQWEDIGPNERGQLMQRNKRTGEKKAIGQGPLVTVNTGDNANAAFLKAISGERAKAISSQIDDAERAKVSNAALTRIEGLLQNPAGLTTGPLIGDWVNTARQAGAALNMNVDINRLQNDAKYELEVRGSLADAILNSSVGRSMTDTDREAIKKAFVNRDIPAQALPAFISQAKERNAVMINRANRIRQQAQTTFGDRTPFALETDVQLEDQKSSGPKVIDFNALPKGG